MEPREIAARLYAALMGSGFRTTIVSADRVSELRDTIKDNLASGKIDEDLRRQYAGYFEGMLTQDTKWAKSIIVVAVPRPRLEIVLTIAGSKRSVIIPPTYEHGIDETVTELIAGALNPHGYRIERAGLPQKLLAARSGLARYGKNNITYVEGIGSFLRLISFYSDLPAASDTWHEPRVLDECVDCTACIKKCPTGAIDPDRFQLHAERCLTYHNESSQAFPSWINGSWHHCLVGCMKCQHFCPVNKGVRSWTQRLAELTEDESTLLLNGTAVDKLPSCLNAKFRGTDLLDDRDWLARNLKCALSTS